MTDADEQEWHYVFDRAGNLHRIIDPNGHQRRLFWSPQAQLLYEASGNLNRDPFYFQPGHAGTLWGSRDHANLRFRRNVYDVRGHLRVSGDGNGLLTHYEYSGDRLVSVTPGMANYSVQGEWQGHYGRDGFLICGATGSADVASLPSYISAITKGTGDVAPVVATFVAPQYMAYEDPRTLRYENDGALVHTKGYWRSAKDESNIPYRRFQFTLEMDSDTNFNLSLYSCASDLPGWSTFPLNYFEHFGYDVEMLVTDSVGTQSFRITNNAGGCWATFPVQPGEGNVLVEIRARGNNATPSLYPTPDNPPEDPLPSFDMNVVGDAVLSGLAFDPYENRTTRMAYNDAGQLTLVVDGMGNTWVNVYDEADGTLVSSLEPGQTTPTQYFYEDAYKNLTSVEDALGGTASLTYDPNGNVTSATDADGRLTTFTVDGRNRVVQVQDAAGNDSFVSYDAGGRVLQSEDAEGRVTSFAYKHQRLWKVTDALEQITSVTYRNSGQVSSVTNARGKVTELTYNAGNELIETEFADGAVLRYALDALGRVTGVTSPNGNQSNVDLINLEGAKNALFNPSGQETRPFDEDSFLDPNGDLAPRYWKPNVAATREVGANGQAYFPLNSTVETWEQKNIPASAGCRYIAQFLARKEDNTSGSTKARMEFEYRLHKDIPYPVGHQVFSDTVEGDEYEPTSQDWETSGRSRLDIPGDTQASLHRPALARARVALSSGSAPLGVSKLQLQRLSTCLEFDGENLREVCFPDGARQRTEYDRLGRAFLTRDPDGRTILREFDALNRVVHVVDSLGNELFFQYSDQMDLVLFRLRSQGTDQDTEFEWDALHRLKSITYMDETTELFEYSAAGDLLSYEDNLGQERTFHYDVLHRLDLITYPDTTTVALSYDKVSNLLTVEERDGKSWVYAYDALNRVVSQQYTGQEGLVSEYNQIGQRMALRKGTVYGGARFGENRYGGGDAIWSVPSMGRDDVGRLLSVEDADSHSTTLQYDVDGRCTQIDHGNSLSDLMTYDIVGKLLSITVQGSEPLLKMQYGYSLGGDRLAQQTDRDTFTYLTDAAGRLVEESHNRFCINQPSVWKQGQWDLVELDEESRSLRLLPFNDTFAGSVMNLQRWTLEGRQVDRSTDNFLHYYDNLDDIPLDELDSVGMEVRQNNGVTVTYPRALHNQTFWHRAAVDNSVGADGQTGIPENEGYPEVFTPHPWWIDMRHRQILVGDFDIALDYEGLNVVSRRRFGLLLGVSPATLNPDVHPDVTWLAVRVQRESNFPHIEFSKSSTAGTYSTNEWVPPLKGEIRLARTGTTFQAWFREQGAPTWFSMSTWSGPSDDMYLYLSFASDATPGSIQVSNLRRLAGNTMATEGTFLSGIYDAGRVVSWDRLAWTENLPAGCDVELEVCVADDFTEFEDFVNPPAFFGPTGGGNFTTPAGEALPSGKTGRYAMVRATLTGNGTDTPTLSDIQLTCNAESAAGSRVIRYRYDQAGNILGITTVDDSGVNKEVRDEESWDPEERINTMNQIMRQDTGHESWRFTWDLNGNLTQKTCGAETFTYLWNDDNRLIQVTKEVTLGGWGAARWGTGTFHQVLSTATAWVVDYTYDSAGRMMTRDDNAGNVTRFYWDGWDMVREVTGESVTEYLIPQGVLLSFKRDGVTYHASCDALGSVRLVTDDEGEVVSRFDYGAFGELLAGSFDGVPGGMPYQWVGGAGVRFDGLTGLYYMRKRWFDSKAYIFSSRDSLGIRGGANTYQYCDSAPVDLIDPMGTCPFLLTPFMWPILEGLVYGALGSAITGGIVRGIFGQPVVDSDAIKTDMMLGAAFSSIGMAYSAYRNASSVATGAADAAATRTVTGWAKGNAAVASVNLGNGVSGKLTSISGYLKKFAGKGLTKPTIPQVFKSVAKGAQKGEYCAERNILAKLLTMLPGGVRGSIRIFSEKMPCEGCTGAAREFMGKFPEVTVDFIHAESKYVVDVFETAMQGALAGFRNAQGPSAEMAPGTSVQRLEIGPLP